MRLARWRFVAAVLLFLGWVGWLVYLWLATHDPVVLSRPQFLVSELDVVARVDDLDQEVVVEEVHFAPKNSPQVGDKLSIPNLRQCKRLPKANETPDQVRPDWTGPGRYILPLRRVGEGFEVARIPHSPGFPANPGPPRIYPLTSETRAQLERIKPREAIP